MFSDISGICLFLAYETLRAIFTLAFSIFFQSSISDEKCIPFQLYLFIKGLIFLLLSKCFCIYSCFKADVTAY